MKIDPSLLPKAIENLRNRRMRNAIARGGSDIKWSFGKAIACGNTATVRKFLDLGASADDHILGPLPGDEKQRYRFHTKPMWMAAQWKQPAVMALLLAAGGGVDGETMDHAIAELDANDPRSIQTVFYMIEHGCDFPGYMGQGTASLPTNPTKRRIAITRAIQKSHPDVQDGLDWIQAESQRQWLEKETPMVEKAASERQRLRL